MNAKNSFADLSDILGKGFGQELGTADYMAQIALTDIEVRAQIREEFEDDENTLEDLGDSLAARQIQNIVLRPNPAGGAKPFLLVAGERRVRSALLKGVTHLWALVAEMTDEEADEVQYQENIHRKNLTMLEEARKVRADLEELGSVEAVLAKHKKNSRAWLSKTLALLNLPAQASRLVKENISADAEVILGVATVERLDEERAQALVEDLKSSRAAGAQPKGGGQSARAKVEKVKAEVKPKKPKPAKEAKASGGSVASAPDRSHEEPSEGRTYTPAPAGPGLSDDHKAELDRAYSAVYEDGEAPQDVLRAMGEADREAIEEFLHTFYEAGKQATDAARVVMQGFRNGGFAAHGAGALALVAYLHGADSRARFNLLNILGAVKP